MSNKRKIAESLNHFRSIFHDSDYNVMSSSEEDEDAEDDADVLSQFKINTKGHKQKYLSLNKSEKDKREKVSDGDASASDEDSPIPSTSKGLRAVKKTHEISDSDGNKTEGTTDGTTDGESDDSIGIVSDSENKTIRRKAFKKKGNQIDLTLNREIHRQEKRFGFQDDLYSVQFHPKGNSTPTLLSLFLAFSEALDLVLNEMRKMYRNRLSSEDHLINICVTEDKIQVKCN